MKRMIIVHSFSMTNMGLSEMNLKDYDFAGLAKR
jgi:hypothetical protein